MSMQPGSLLARYDLTAFVARHASLLVGLAIVSILLLLLLPIPPSVLDLFICISLASSLMLLMVVIRVESPTSLSTFPSLLLLTTLLRLAITIASTKMILLDGHAGRIVHAFGQLVVGGNVLVGLVMFAVLCAVQFIVIAKGSDRVAEVAARFTLDGIPGRQMSIDADLRAGVIHANQASALRRNLERETYLYGAMDGAMKFVKGDSIASLVVALVNIVGGLAVGIAQRDMGFSEALNTYTVLTVGDGLVAQIPSLMVSVSAAMFITRVASPDGATNHLGGDIHRQLSRHPQAIAMTGVTSIALGLMPGIPILPFLATGGFLVALAALLFHNERVASNSQRAHMPAMTRDGGHYTPRILDDVELGTCAPLRVRLSKTSLQALQPEALNQQLESLRRRLTLVLGLPFPGISLLLDSQLPENYYVVDIDDVPLVSNTLVPGMDLASSPDPYFDANGLAGYRPGYSASRWVDRELGQRLKDADLVTATADSVLCMHLFEVLHRHAEKFVGVQEARFMLDQLGIEFRELVGKFEERLSIVQLVPVLRALLRDEISIRNLRVILEALLGIPAPDVTQERMLRDVRISLGAQIVRPLVDADGITLRASSLDPEWQMALESHVRTGPDGEPHCMLPAQELHDIERVFPTLQPSHSPILTSAILRPHLSALLVASGNPLRVLAIEEVGVGNYRIDVHTTIARP